MRNEKLKKQLMAVGIQRNDADAFIRLYRKIQKSGKAEQFLPRIVMVVDRKEYHG